MRGTLVKGPEPRRQREAQVQVRRRVPPGAAIFSTPIWAGIARSLHLTQRELQIVCGVFDDLTEYAIAADLGISVHTVHTHLERLRHKLAATDRAALILRVVEEFLSLTRAPDSEMPPICGKRTAGLCHVRD